MTTPFLTPEQLAQQQRADAESEAARLRAAVEEAFKHPCSDGSYYASTEGYSSAAVAIIVEELRNSRWTATYESDMREGSALRIRPATAAPRGGGNDTAWC